MGTINTMPPFASGTPLRKAQSKILGEKEFQKRIVKALCLNKKALILEGFGLDVAVFTQKNLFFLELKYYSKNHNRIGIGQGSGRGNQIALLKGQHGHRFITKNIFWALCDASIKPEKYYLFSSSDVFRKKLLAKNKLGKKYNNFKIGAIRREKSLDWDELIKKIKKSLQ